MTPSHSPLPWTVHGYTIRDAMGDPVAHQVFPEDGDLIITAAPLQGSEMTSPDYGDLVRRLRYGRACDGLESLPDWYRLCTKAADALEQQAREVAAREGALRNSGNMVRALNAEVLQLCKKYDRLCFELNSRGIPLPGEPDTRGTGYAGEVGCGMKDKPKPFVEHCVLRPRKGEEPLFIVCSDGEIIPQLNNYAVIPCEEYEAISRDLAAARREVDTLSVALAVKQHPEFPQELRSAYENEIAVARREKEEVLAAFEQLAFKGCRALSDNADLRRENEEMRERTIEECVNTLADFPREIDPAIDSTYRCGYRQGLDAAEDAIRSLATQPDPPKSMTETLMNPKEQKFWDTADRQADKDGGK